MEKNLERQRKIIELYNKGLFYAAIGELFGISRQRVHQIVKNYSSNSIAVDSKYRKKILKRDKEKCILCKRKSKNIIVHHINSDRKNNTDENLVCLCRSCHTKIHNKEQFSIEFSQYKKYIEKLKNIINN